MQKVMQEINIARIVNTNAKYTYDELEMSGSEANWKEVLFVYEVKTSTDLTHPQEVVTMNASEKASLKDEEQHNQ